MGWWTLFRIVLFLVKGTSLCPVYVTATIIGVSEEYDAPLSPVHRTEPRLRFADP